MIGHGGGAVCSKSRAVRDEEFFLILPSEGCGTLAGSLSALFFLSFLERLCNFFLHIKSTPPTLVSKPLFIPIQLCVFLLLFFFQSMKANLCCPNILRYVVFHRSLAIFPVAIPIGKTVSPSPSTWHLPVANPTQVLVWIR